MASARPIGARFTAALAALILVSAAAAPLSEPLSELVAGEDECQDDAATCGLALLQHRSLKVTEAEFEGSVAIATARADFAAAAAGWGALATAGGSDGRHAAVHIAWHSDASFCLSSDGNRIENGAKIQLWKCDTTWGSVGQNFYADYSGRIRMAQDPSYCVVVDGDRFEDGAQVQLWKCDEKNKNQTWTWQHLHSGNIHLPHQPKRMCMVIDNNEASDGAKIQVWSCSKHGHSAAVQKWIQLALSANRKTMYSVPNTDKACPSPFKPVDHDSASCVAAANAMRPGSGCSWPGTIRTWAQIAKQASEPSCPRGCYFYGACQGGCGLYFNPSGHTDPERSCKDEGNCFSISVICQLSV